MRTTSSRDSSLQCLLRGRFVGMIEELSLRSFPQTAASRLLGQRTILPQLFVSACLGSRKNLLHLVDISRHVQSIGFSAAYSGWRVRTTVYYLCVLPERR